MRDSRLATHRVELLAQVRRTQPVVCIKCGKCLYVAFHRAEAERFEACGCALGLPLFFTASFYLIHLFIGTEGVSPQFAIKRYYPTLVSLDYSRITITFFLTMEHLGLSTHSIYNDGVMSLKKKSEFKYTRASICLIFFVPIEIKKILNIIT